MASPRGPRVPSTWIRIASTPLAAIPTCMSVGSPVIAKSPTKPASTRRSPAAVGLLLGLLVGNDPQPHPHLVLLAQVGERQQQAGERALHVVGAAPVQALSLQPRG